jgi:pyruvate formate lyase activating enzyme
LAILKGFVLLVRAILQEQRDDKRVKCLLCPRFCNIPDGKTGFCVVRKNHGGVLFNEAYGRPSAVHIDPIEKKPLFHYLPGSASLSIGTVGCTLNCKFCQNYDLSRGKDIGGTTISPEKLVELARRNYCASISFTYNEPTIQAEYIIDTAPIAAKANIGIVMVTNGYITKEGVRLLYSHVDAANVDLKAFSDDFYRRYCSGHLSPVLDALVEMKALGVHLEITTLLIPELNTDLKMIKEESLWILHNLGADTPVHFTAFHPDYKMLDRPRTPLETLLSARKCALEAGLKFVYLGNVYSDGANTYCPSCHAPVIERSWHDVRRFSLDDSKCQCGQQIPIVTSPVRSARL